MEDLIRDLRLALRALIKQPVFALTAIFLLALAIGANTAVFSILDHLLLRPLPYPGADRLITLWNDNRARGWSEDLTSFPNFEDWQQSSSFEAMSALTPGRLAISSGEGEPEQVRGAYVSANFFEVFRVEPALGRGFAVEEEQPGYDTVIVLSHRLWQRRFGSDPNIVGQQILVRGRKFEVIGVMPREFRYPYYAEAWVPLVPTPLERQERRLLWLEVIARLVPDRTLDQAREEMEVLAYRLERLHPMTNEGVGISVVPLVKRALRELRPTMLLLQTAVILVLLIALSNLVSLVLVRATERLQDLAVRKAFGASRWGIVRRQLVESLVLSVIGGVVGLVVARWGVRALQAATTNEVLSGATIGVDASVVLFACALAILTGLISGFLPALRLASIEVSPLLKGGGALAASSLKGSRLRQALVVWEVAITLVLLIGTGLLVRSAQRLQSVDLGFRIDHLTTVQMILPPERFQNPSEMADFYTRLVERVGALPGVAGAGIVSTIFDGEGSRSDRFTIQDQMADDPREQLEVAVDMASPGFFQAMGIPLIAGRDFNAQDGETGAPTVIINQAMAERYWPGENPLGRMMKYGGPRSPDPWMEIVGVVGNVKRSLLTGEVRPATYRSHWQAPFNVMTLVVRGETSSQLGPALRGAIWSIDDQLPINRIATFEQLLASLVSERRFRMQLLGVLSGVALILTLVGTYGLMTHVVQRSRREIGIRMALGAIGASVVRPLVAFGLRLALIGIVLGWTASLLLNKLLESLLFEISSYDPMVLIVVPVLLLLVSALAVYLPARRATRVDPARTLAEW